MDSSHNTAFDDVQGWLIEVKIKDQRNKKSFLASLFDFEKAEAFLRSFLM
jgi:hypothetical protein